AKDFTVTENGAPQTIRFCEFQKLEETLKPAITTPPPQPDTAKVAAVTRNQIAPEPPGDIRYKDRRLLVLYFDMTAMPVPDQLRALTAARKFIGSQMAPPDLLAIMQFSGGAVKVLQDFTDDRDQLAATIQTVIAGEGQGLDDAI